MTWKMMQDDPIVHPRIPAGILGNHAFKTAREARAAAKIAANRLNRVWPGHRVVHEYRHGPGQNNHFHVVDPSGKRVSGHFYYGKLPYWAPVGRGLSPERRRKRAFQREMEAWPEYEVQYSPIVTRICPNARRYAARMATAMRRARAMPEPYQRRYAIERVRRIAGQWLGRKTRQLLPLADRLQPEDLNQIVSCLTAVEAASGYRGGALRPLRAVAARRLGIRIP